MKAIIAGGRTYQFTAYDVLRLDRLLTRVPITEVVCGGARGADECGKLWAESRGLYCRVFPADWDRFGKSAGMRRNAEMAAYADVAVLFPGGRGTDNMAETALRKGLMVYDFRL